jgi:hypothetical protein
MHDMKLECQQWLSKAQNMKSRVQAGRNAALRPPSMAQKHERGPTPLFLTNFDQL